MLAPLQRADLSLGVDCVKAGSSLCVPETDHAISSTTSRCKQILLPWAPCQSFYCGVVLCAGVQRVVVNVGVGRRRCQPSIPDVEKVVVASGCQLCALWVPLKAAHFLLLPHREQSEVDGNRERERQRQIGAARQLRQKIALANICSFRC